ncbi:MAG: hydroxymethylglutaryl-CoA lyase [Burkholderiaceae bacterium]|jgi:hydroxymethylglutaryl-CoA lyase
MKKKVKVVEVSPRDGLQNEKAEVSTETKIALIEKLAQAGITNIESASFVSPKWVPQMADGAAVMAGIARRPGTWYSVLTPNLKGYEGAAAAQADEVVIFGAASETFSQRNINCTVAESIERFRPVAQAAHRDGIALRGSISCCLGCPYEGEISPAQVMAVVDRLIDLGCHEIDVADTIGVGTPEKTKRVFEAVATKYALERFSGHFHDTYGQAIANVYAALEVGVSIFHGSVAGLGGCPYAKGATGNVATEDLVYLLHGLGIETGIDFDALCEAGAFISGALARKSNAKAGPAWLSKKTLSAC